mmetsp:Transcript_63031/g.179138  ORF Transcript_63031/g.179138 Transcript_63031/m.179138 type:complete len:286 (+) Transcript_63031:235-1092(+)
MSLNASGGSSDSSVASSVTGAAAAGPGTPVPTGTAGRGIFQAASSGTAGSAMHWTSAGSAEGRHGTGAELEDAAAANFSKLSFWILSAAATSPCWGHRLEDCCATNDANGTLSRSAPGGTTSSLGVDSSAVCPAGAVETAALWPSPEAACLAALLETSSAPTPSGAGGRGTPVVQSLAADAGACRGPADPRSRCSSEGALCFDRDRDLGWAEGEALRSGVRSSGPALHRASACCRLVAGGSTPPNSAARLRHFLATCEMFGGLAQRACSRCTSAARARSPSAITP